MAGVLPTRSSLLAALAKEALAMAENASLDLTGVAETLLITLYLRAMESQRPDALIIRICPFLHPLARAAGRFSGRAGRAKKPG